MLRGLASTLRPANALVSPTAVDPGKRRASAKRYGAYLRGVTPEEPIPSLLVLGGTELGGISPDAASRLLGQTKVIALLAYLAVAARGRYVRRDRLVGLLWPELDQTHARAALRKVVHTIRATLGDTVLLTRGDEELALSAENMSCDAVQFALNADAGHLLDALELYRGDLLEGFHLAECGEYMMWLDAERSAIQERAAAAAVALSRKLEVDEQYTMAGAWARRAIRFSWSNERVLRQALSMLDRLGDRAGALRLFEDFSKRLRRELDAEPSAETLAVVAKLRA